VGGTHDLSIPVELALRLGYTIRAIAAAFLGSSTLLTTPAAAVLAVILHVALEAARAGAHLVATSSAVRALELSRRRAIVVR
jgi:hypothetical protein